MPVTNKALPIMNKLVSPKAEVTAKAANYRYMIIKT